MKQYVIRATKNPCGAITGYYLTGRTSGWQDNPTNGMELNEAYQFLDDHFWHAKLTIHDCGCVFEVVELDD